MPDLATGRLPVTFPATWRRRVRPDPDHSDINDRSNLQSPSCSLQLEIHPRALHSVSRPPILPPSTAPPPSAPLPSLCPFGPLASPKPPAILTIRSLTRTRAISTLDRVRCQAALRSHCEIGGVCHGCPCTSQAVGPVSPRGLPLHSPLCASNVPVWLGSAHRPGLFLSPRLDHPEGGTAGRLVRHRHRVPSGAQDASALGVTYHARGGAAVVAAGSGSAVADRHPTGQELCQGVAAGG